MLRSLVGSEMCIRDSLTMPFCISNIYLWTDDDVTAQSLLHSLDPTPALMAYLSPKNMLKVEQVLKATGLNEEEAEILHKNNNQAGLYAERKYFDNNNRHIVTASSVHASDKYEYATVLHRKHH